MVEKICDKIAIKNVTYAEKEYFTIVIKMAFIR